MFCTNCGKELKEGAAFCTGCGKEVNAAQKQPADQPESPLKSVSEPDIMPEIEHVSSNVAQDVERVALRPDRTGGQVPVNETCGDMHIILKKRRTLIELIVNGMVVSEQGFIGLTVRAQARIGNDHIEVTMNTLTGSCKIFVNGEFRAKNSFRDCFRYVMQQIMISVISILLTIAVIVVGIAGLRFFIDNFGGNSQGHGTLTFTDGVYIGDVVDGMKHGHGTFAWANGAVYTGEFVDGYRHGHGTFTSANGDVYTGDFVDGVLHGHGTFTFANGNVYTGDVVDGMRHGHGTFTWANGNVYTGDWVEDVQHGHGTLTSANGDVLFTGSWVEGRRDVEAWLFEDILYPQERAVGMMRTSTDVNFRSDPGFDYYSIIRQLPAGTSVEVLENQADGWSLVRHRGTAGFIRSSFLVPLEDATNQNRTAAEYLDAQDQGALYAAIAEVRNMGLDLAITAHGDTIVYTYTYLEQIRTDTYTFAVDESVLSAQAELILSEMGDFGVQNPAVRFIYRNADGKILYQGDFN